MSNFRNKRASDLVNEFDNTTKCGYLLTPREESDKTRIYNVRYNRDYDTRPQYDGSEESKNLGSLSDFVEVFHHFLEEQEVEVVDEPRDIKDPEINKCNAKNIKIAKGVYATDSPFPSFMNAKDRFEAPRIYLRVANTATLGMDCE